MLLGIGEDGLARCPWAAGHPVNRDYHDTEWGVPILGEAAYLERLTLEAFQSGLSWLTILNKRPTSGRRSRTSTPRPWRPTTTRTAPA